MEQTGYAFVPPQKPGNYPPMMGTSQEQALRTKIFRQNQVIFSRCTAKDGEIKKQIIAVVQPFFLYPLLYQLKGFIKLTALQILLRIFNSYRVIDEIELKENAR